MNERLTENERLMADRVGKRAAEAVRQGASHLDAITTQMQASGVDPWDRGYMAIGRRALNVLLAEIPAWQATAKVAHTAGWAAFAAEGQPNREEGNTDTEEEEEEPTQT